MSELIIACIAIMVSISFFAFVDLIKARMMGISVADIVDRRRRSQENVNNKRRGSDESD